MKTSGKKKKKLLSEDELQKAIGLKIKSLRMRSRKPLSVSYVAKKLKINRVRLTQIENGNRNANAVLLWKIACLFGCEIKDLFPPIPHGYQISERDIEELKKIDEKVAVWAEELFGKPSDKEII